MNTTKRIELTVSRTIPATPEEVYDVVLDPKIPGSFWFGAAKAIVNTAVDGMFYLAMQHEGRLWPHYGRFLRLERGRVIEHTWMSEATSGIETTVTVTLQPKGDETVLTLVHANVPDDAMGRQHEEGWKFITGALVERFLRHKR